MFLYIFQWFIIIIIIKQEELLINYIKLNNINIMDMERCMLIFIYF
jgi:hypothetical protein